MSTSRDISKCHKTRIEKCNGHKCEPIENYVKWAYWYGDKCGTQGWHSKPSINCKCK